MTIDEAIRKQEHWAGLEEQNAASWRNDPFNRVTEAEMSSEYAAEHRQLAEWLRELKRLRAQNPCKDAVSRVDVLECFSDLYDTFEDCSKGIVNELHRKFDDLRTLPSVTPERKKGKWISKGYGEYRCSSCRNIVDLDEEILMSIKMFDYCPVCGADMREDQDGKSD